MTRLRQRWWVACPGMARIWTWTIWPQNLGPVASCGSYLLFCLFYLEDEACRPILVGFLKIWHDLLLSFYINFSVTENRIKMYPILHKLYHLSKNDRVHHGMFLLYLLYSIFTVTVLNILRYLFWAQVLGVTAFCILVAVAAQFVRCAFSAKLTLFFFPSTTGHHCPLRKAPLTHSISELHDDQCPERQPGRELHDDHDCHPLFREKEYRRMLLLLSGDLSLSFYASLWDGVEGPGWVCLFNWVRVCLQRWRPTRVHSFGLFARIAIPPIWELTSHSTGWFAENHTRILEDLPETWGRRPIGFSWSVLLLIT